MSTHFTLYAYVLYDGGRVLYIQLTTFDGATQAYNGPNLRKRYPQSEERFINNSIKKAEEKYLLFILKMESKINKEIIKAAIDGTIWTNALITVETVDGEIQVWKTKMIINFSKYNKMFNQFPTRRIK